MVYKHRDLIKLYGTDYKIKKLIDEGLLVKFDNGLYSDSGNINYMEFLFKKYPNAVISGKTAYFCYNLIDEMDGKISVSTPRDTTKIRNNGIKQTFVTEKLYKLGIVSLNFNGSQISIYDKEKLLIELVRNKSKLSNQEYNIILYNYKLIKDTLDRDKIDTYIKYYPNGNKINSVVEWVFA